MAIRLTESRLRQIIREEASKLTRRPTRRLRESPGAGASARRPLSTPARYGTLLIQSTMEILTHMARRRIWQRLLK